MQDHIVVTALVTIDWCLFSGSSGEKYMKTDGEGEWTVLPLQFSSHLPIHTSMVTKLPCKAPACPLGAVWGMSKPVQAVLVFCYKMDTIWDVYIFLKINSDRPIKKNLNIVQLLKQLTMTHD